MTNAVYYLVYLTERCNLTCTYCEGKEARRRFTQEVDYDLERLVAFLGADPEACIQFYGGEPTLRGDLMAEVLRRTKPRHVTLQTNGTQLDSLADEVLARLDVVSVSLDGSAEVTDRMRGAGTYAAARAQIERLRERGYRGAVDARMTISPGVDVERAVSHLLDDEVLGIDSVYWQLNVMFHEVHWPTDGRLITRWFESSYNPGVTRLIARWVEALERGERRLRIVPFAGVAHTLLTGATVAGLRCGAGREMWTIATNGEVYPCPVMRGSPALVCGDVRTHTPSELASPISLGAPCASCDVRGVCGGRCLVTNTQKRWGEAGFELVCGSVRHLIAEVERVVPRLRALMSSGSVQAADFAISFDYEVIP